MSDDGYGKIAPGKAKLILDIVVAGLWLSLTFCPAKTFPIVPELEKLLFMVESWTFLEISPMAIGKTVVPVGLDTSGK